VAAVSWNALVNVHSGSCLDVKYADPNPGAEVILWPCHGGQNQLWAYFPDGSIRNQLNEGLCLDIAYADQSNGARLIMWPCNGQSNQGWLWEYFNYPYAQFRTDLNNKCLDGDLYHADHVQVWECLWDEWRKPQRNQLWKWE